MALLNIYILLHIIFMIIIVHIFYIISLICNYLNFFEKKNLLIFLAWMAK